MIDTAHLRIGNLVQHYKMAGNKLAYAVSSIHGRVTAIQGKHFIIDHKISSQNSKAEPIPVTPEILKKAGFKKYRVGDKQYPGEVFYHKEPMQTDRLMWSDFEKRVCFYTDTYAGLGHRVFYRPRIDYLHQLQNAFFAFYSEELEINL